MIDVDYKNKGLAKLLKWDPRRSAAGDVLNVYVT